jgi:predicted kinase
MLLIVSGRSGTGKTTIARETARRLDAVYVRIDSIEQAIRDSSIVTPDVDDAGYRVGCAIAADNLRLGRTVVADSVNPLRLTRDAWHQVARGSGVEAIDVEIVCSDRAEHRRRVEARVSDIAGHRLPSWPEIVEREYQRWSGDRIVIDTANATVEASVDALCAAVRCRGGATRVRAAARVIVITGSMGAGKTTVMAEASDILSERGIVHAAIDLDALAIGHPAATAPYEMAYLNLEAVWRNFAAAGVSALLAAGAIESRVELDRLRVIVGDGALAVCRLRAPLAVMQARVRAREPGMLQAQLVERVTVLETVLDAASLEDFTLVNDGRAVTEVAREMLVRAGWIGSRSG